MITFRTSADITADRQIVVNLPPETPTGKAELVVTINPQNQTTLTSGALRRRFGTVRSGDSRFADNDRIDLDLSRAYANPAE